MYVLHCEFNRCLLCAVSSTGRCNAILNQGGRCHETKNSQLIADRNQSNNAYVPEAEVAYIMLS